ncbi:MAG: cytochrome P450 [Deltaproteobacteria bacterium]|nr:cytochrome P450 [Deltaproteobacteria bacterium]MBW2448017.1 cytochrome P450 [Deltaproteobacteria bacterium]
MTADAFQPDLQSHVYQSDPVPTLHRLREEDPVHRSRHGYWFLTRYDHVKFALRDPRFSSDWARRQAERAGSGRGAPAAASPYEESETDRENRQLILSSFNMKDGRDHSRIRTLVNHAFGKAALESRRGRVQEVVDELLDGAAARGSFDLVTELGFPLPMVVASEMIGIPGDERERFRRSFEEAGVLGVPGHSAELHATALEALDWQLGLARGLVEARRERPEDDLITALVEAEEEGDKLSVDEIISAVVTIFTAAGTTTERFVSSGLLLLLQHPEEQARLRSDPALLPTAMEEILRFHHPDQSTSTARWVTEDVELGEKVLRKGDRVRLGLGAANRDPSQFPDPDRLDLARTPNRHLAFGRGAHFCVGAGLARLEAEVAILATLDRFPQIELLTKEPRRDPRRMDRYEEIRVRV